MTSGEDTSKDVERVRKVMRWWGGGRKIVRKVFIVLRRESTTMP